MSQPRHIDEQLKGKQDGKSNFNQLPLLWAEDDEVLRKWIEKSYDKYMSPNVQN